MRVVAVALVAVVACADAPGTKPAFAPAPLELRVGLAGMRVPPRSAGVRAGSSDDNVAYDAFLKFLRDTRGLGLPHDASERVVVEVRDRAGLPVFGARVAAFDGDKLIAERRTYPDGRALLFHLPRTARVRVANLEQRAGPKTLRFDLPERRSELQRVPLDIAFVLDTTGSMSDELERLRQTLDVIHFQLTHLESSVDIRFGLMEYKDRGDEFVTRPIPFTSDVERFAEKLQSLRAGGGGDEPEDVQAALEQSLHTLQWRDDAVKIAFLIGDAAPHLDYGEEFTYVDAMKEAARRGIKLAAVGCSGLPIQGEVVWRELAQYTMGPYVFLTRGERGDMEGSVDTVSHHVGPNFAAENLETIVVRLVKTELAPLQPRLVARGGR